jgi:hypothetical protein
MEAPTVRGCREIEKLGSFRLPNTKAEAIASALQKGLQNGLEYGSLKRAS